MRVILNTPKEKDNRDCCPGGFLSTGLSHLPFFTEGQQQSLKCEHDALKWRKL